MIDTIHRSTVHRICWVIVWLGIIFGGQHPTNAAERGFTTRGDTFAGELTRIESNGLPLFSDHEPLAADELVYWGQVAENQQDPHVLLKHGSTLIGNVLNVAPDTITLGADPHAFREWIWQPLTLPRTWVLGAVFHSPPGVRARDQLFDEIRQHIGDKDVLWLANGDRLDGLLAVSALTGRNPTWRMRTETGDVELPTDAVVAVALRRSADSDVSSDAQTTVLGLRDGSRIAAQTIAQENGQITLQLGDDAQLAIDARQLMESICYFRPGNQNVQYLSDLQPLGYRHIPYLSTEWPYFADRSVLGTRLRWDQSLYEKGLGVHSTCRLAYEIPAGSQRFQAELALDASANQQGSVIYRVYVQPAGGEWQMAYESDVIRGGQPPQFLDLPLQDARRIALIVDFADRGDELDRANWLMARFVR